MLAFNELRFLKARVLMRCAELELNDTEVSGLLYPGLGSAKHDAEIRVRILDEVFSLLLNIPFGERIAWLREPNSGLAGDSPLRRATTYSSGLRAVRNLLRVQFEDRPVQAANSAGSGSGSPV